MAAGSLALMINDNNDILVQFLSDAIVAIECSLVVGCVYACVLTSTVPPCLHLGMVLVLASTEKVNLSYYMHVLNICFVPVFHFTFSSI